MTTECLPCQEQLAAETAPKRAEWSGPIGIENQRTGDGRNIERNALRWDTLPIPLRWAMQDFGAHDGAYVVGKIEGIERIDYDEANKRLTATGRDPLPENFTEAVIIWGSGSHDLGSEYGREAFRQTDEGLTPGISMDLDDIVIEDDEGDDFTIKEGRIRAATQVAIPAFEGARISTSKGARETFDPAQRLDDLALLAPEEAFNWVEDVGGLPEYIKRIEKHLEKKGMTESHAIATAVKVVQKMCATGDVNFPGAQQVNAGSRAEACAAVEDWEAKKAAANASAAEAQDADAEALVASAAPFPADWFRKPRMDAANGVTVTDEGQVFGYVALWDTCHIANPQGPKVCTRPPRSASDYAYLHTGVVTTTEGDVAVGRLTINTLHAGPKLTANDTIYHYEHTGMVGAYVRAYEDERGILIAGAARPGMEDDLRMALKAAPASGDWRRIRGGLEMVGVLGVNVPGFPVPRTEALVASGVVQSLVASGTVPVENPEPVMDLDDATVLALRERFRAMDRAERAQALAARVARARAYMTIRRAKEALAYNPDQWRVPKGNPEGGRWVDMPGVGLDDLEQSFEDIADRVPETESQGIADNLADARNFAEQSADALKAGDGETAKDMAQQADEALSKVEAAAHNLADGGALSDVEMENLGAALEQSRGNVGRVADSDLSLLGDEGPGGDSPEGDIGGPDASKAPPKESGDIGADEPKPGGVVSSEGASADLFPQDRKPLDDNGFKDIREDGDGMPVRYADSNGWQVVMDQDGTWNMFEPEEGTSLTDIMDQEPYPDAASAIEARDILLTSPDGGDFTPAGGGSAADKIPDSRDVLDSTKPGDVVSIDDGMATLRQNEDGGWEVLDSKIEGVESGDILSDGDVYAGGDTKIEKVDGPADGGPADGGANDAAEPASTEAGEAPDGVNQGVWEDLTQEQRDAVSAAISGGKSPQDALRDAQGPQGSAQQQKAAQVNDTASVLEQTLQDAIDGGGWQPDDADADDIGVEVDALRERVDALTEGIRDGDYNAADLAAAQNALSSLESALMAEADRGTMPDGTAAQIGTALDDLFAQMGELAGLLQGSMEPPPFATRKYVRQWLGRRGIRAGRFARKGVMV
jgi:hypothetical protein